MELCELLKSNAYPGRGIALGRSADNKRVVMVYFIMGRSENSRNRIFEETADGIRTKAFDESKMIDPSLIIYHPVRVLESGFTVVTNGDQTDTIRDHMAQGHCYRHALNTRAFEPDGPNWTPRISGVVKPDGAYNLSILKSLDGDPACCCRYFFEYDKPVAGRGHFISTYQGDGDPLPSFAGEPRLVPFGNETARELADKLWTALNGDNKVSLFVRLLDIATGESDTVIVNKHQ
ncbi:MAG: inosine monophosphate cyclohydrolase [Oscillospiraceae bacterium]|nr:inosine monophosphate cyclohydrolase [Oscillospiraceae bacterium]